MKTDKEYIYDLIKGVICSAMPYFIAHKYYEYELKELKIANFEKQYQADNNWEVAHKLVNSFHGFLALNTFYNYCINFAMKVSLDQKPLVYLFEHDIDYTVLYDKWIGDVNFSTLSKEIEGEIE